MSHWENDKWFEHHFTQAVESYKKQGFSQEEAEKRAKEYVDELWEADTRGDL